MFKVQFIIKAQVNIYKDRVEILQKTFFITMQ